MCFINGLGRLLSIIQVIIIFLNKFLIKLATLERLIKKAVSNYFIDLMSRLLLKNTGKKENV